VCTSTSALLVHRYKEHGVAVPNANLHNIDINTNREVFRRLQESESQFRVIYNTNLGECDVDIQDKSDRAMLRQHEFVKTDDGLLYCIDVSGVRSRSRAAHTAAPVCA
jgi:hypothetical protein